MPISCTDLEFSRNEDRLGLGGRGRQRGEGKETEEFLRPEKRGKHVTELHESFIRL